MTRACKDCCFFESDKKECRRLSPSKDGFPKVKPDCWCGCFSGSQHRRIMSIPQPRDPLPHDIIKLVDIGY